MKLALGEFYFSFVFYFPFISFVKQFLLSYGIGVKIES